MVLDGELTVRTLLVLALSLPVLFGAAFRLPKTDGNYRVWVGANDATDWIDVCCHVTENGTLEFADYTPIEEIQASHVSAQTKYKIWKKYSAWELTGVEGDASSWVLTETSRLLP